MEVKSLVTSQPTVPFWSQTRKNILVKKHPKVLLPNSYSQFMNMINTSLSAKS